MDKEFQSKNLFREDPRSNDDLVPFVNKGCKTIVSNFINKRNNPTLETDMGE